MTQGYATRARTGGHGRGDHRVALISTGVGSQRKDASGKIFAASQQVHAFNGQKSECRLSTISADPTSRSPSGRRNRACSSSSWFDDGSVYKSEHTVTVTDGACDEGV